jgi:hypothetical protein
MKDTDYIVYSQKAYQELERCIVNHLVFFQHH